MVSMASSMIFIFALGLVYASVGTVNMAQAGMRLEEIPDGTKHEVAVRIWDAVERRLR